MLKKIILPVVLLALVHQEFYGTAEKENNDIVPKINNWVNIDRTKKEKNKYPKLWFLWAFLDNVPFQYGSSKIWKHGEAYYGLSNGIGFFPSILNFGWLKIGFIDAHINGINLISDYFKSFIQLKKDNNFDTLSFLLLPAILNLFFNIHIISLKILNCIKIKLIAPLTLLFQSITDMIGAKEGEKESTQWYITYNSDGQISWWYGLLSPRIEINIPGIINYFK